MILKQSEWLNLVPLNAIHVVLRNSKFSWNRLQTKPHDNSNIWLRLQRWLLCCSVRTHRASPPPLSPLYTHTASTAGARMHTCTDWHSQMAESLWLSPKPPRNSCGCVWVCTQHKEIHLFDRKLEARDWLSDLDCSDVKYNKQKQTFYFHNHTKSRTQVQSII